MVGACVATVRLSVQYPAPEKHSTQRHDRVGRVLYTQAHKPVASLPVCSRLPEAGSPPPPGVLIKTPSYRGLRSFYVLPLPIFLIPKFREGEIPLSVVEILASH